MINALTVFGVWVLSLLICSVLYIGYEHTAVQIFPARFAPLLHARLWVALNNGANRTGKMCMNFAQLYLRNGQSKSIATGPLYVLT